MISACPICDRSNFETLLAVDRAPVFQLLSPGEDATEECFAPLQVVGCLGCGHFYNRTYPAGVGERACQRDVLRCEPVNPSMQAHLQQIAQWIEPVRYAGKHVVEVGAAGGHFASVLARDAKSVLVVEPSSALKQEMLIDARITVINELFSAARCEERADLMVSRHVLESVMDPLEFLREMRVALNDDGRLYLEVPRAEYIEQNAALFDLHYDQIHYFHESHLCHLARRAGFVAERRWVLKGGHDFGVMLRPSDAVDGSKAPSHAAGLPEFRSRLSRIRSDGCSFIARLSGDVALYGASWHGVAFLSLFESDRPFAFVLDGNASYSGHRLYSQSQVLATHAPSAEVLRGVDNVIVTAYLHEKAISQNLRELGFKGRVVSICPEFRFI